jgi:phenylalanyl-tRNA synthetase beta chain
MKFTLSWLKAYLETHASLDTICEKLTAIGLEVEQVRDPAAMLEPFIVAQVLTAEKHPSADRLRVTTVDTGSGIIQVVCGAPNCVAGLKTVLARPGDIMPDSGEALKKGVIRGVESQGMLCAADELKLSATETSGIIELPADAPVGANYAEYAGLNDPLIEINLTPNRPDCAGVYGIARDLAAAGIGTLKPLAPASVAGKEKSSINVTLDFPADQAKNCPLFVGRLIRNIKNGGSPAWVQQRLTSIGLRPISALVDITNLLTIDCNRPLHVFDAKKINGNVWLRPAKGGETFAALDGNTYVMQAGMTIIGDDTGVISLAGIMGGETTKCDENTTEVFIEAAYFDPVRTARTGRALNISSDARYRFERGIDPNFTEAGMELATGLVLEFCGTPQAMVSDLVVAGAVPAARAALSLNPALCQKLTSVDVAVAEQISIMNALGFQVKDSVGQLNVTPPSWRPDIDGAADLVEEIIRIKGFDKIPTSSLKREEAVPASAIDLADQRLSAARRALAGQGLMEAVTWSFMPSGLAATFGGGDATLRLTNPISSDLDAMRPTILGNLLQAAKRNADRGFADIGLFEIGPVFHNASPDGQAVVANALRAGQSPRHWASVQRAVDAFDAKADAIAALAAAGAPTASLQVTTDAPGWYHPGRSGALRLGPTLLAYFGEFHPSVLAKVDAAAPVVVSEIFIANIPQSRSSGTSRPLLKLEPLQPVSRDFAFVVDADVSAAKLIKAVRDADKNLIRDVAVFDVYVGEHVAVGKKSVALSVTLQPTDKTLTDTDIDALANRVTATVAKATGAVLRG